MKKILILASLAITTAGFAQKVDNKIHFQKGQKLEMDITLNSTITSAMGEAKVDGLITRSFDVEDVKDGNAVVEHKVKRIKVNFESAMGTQSFDSENEADLNSEAGKTAEKSLKNKYTMVIDPTGRVVSVKLDDDNPNTDSSRAPTDMMSNLLAQTVEGMKVPAPGDKTDFSILPDRQVSVGDTWTDSSDNKKTVYTVVDVNENDIAVIFNQTENVHVTQQSMGMDIVLNSVDTTTGRIRIDRKTGLLKEKSANTVSEGTMEAMGQSAPVSKKIARSWVVR
jgi:hypothetical protein